MKKITIVVMITIALLLCVIVPIHVFAAEQEPTMIGDYYQIETAAHLEWFGDQVKNGNQSIKAKLCNDIDISTLNNRACIIGNNSKAFKGEFDGQGYTINGLSLTASETGVGLFGALDGATIKGFTLNGSIADDSEKTPSYIGAVAGRGKGGATIYGVTVNVDITENSACNAHVGGIIGGSESNAGGTLTVEKCIYNGTINVPNVTDCIGGIIGYANENVYIINCGSIGTITNNNASAKVGGILGYVNSSGFKELSGCYSDMTLTTASGNEQIGGIIGWLRSAGEAVIHQNVCKSSITPYGKYTGNTFTAHQVSNWQSDITSYLSDLWTQNLGMNEGRPIFKSSLPSYDLVLTPASGLPNYNYENGVLTLLGGGTYTLTMKSGKTTTSSPLIINNSAELTLNVNNVNIDCSEGSTPAIRIGSSAEEVTLNLIGTNILKSGENCAGLQKENDMTLTIDGAGSLSATGGNKGAGIGGGNSQQGYNITVNSGTVTATGGNKGAGIGGGNDGDADYIFINGGAVTANGGNCGAGIGGGNEGDGGTRNVSGGSIIINGGTVTAKGGDHGAGIGGGYFGNGKYIFINSGTVTANGGYCGAGIGGGYYGNGGAVINNGNVTAKGGNSGAGIGGGSDGDGGTVTITGGDVTANGGNYGAGIGGGNHGSGGTFSTGKNGSAYIIASSISDQSYKTNPATGGIIIDGGNVTVGGAQTLNENITIAFGKTLTIPEGSTLTVATGVTLTNNGTIIKIGDLINNGTVNGSGVISDGLPEAYLDASGAEQECKVYKYLTAEYLSENSNLLTAGWYVVNGVVNAPSRITISGAVHIILADVSHLKVENGGIHVAEGNSLTVYAQSSGENMGALIATGGENAAGIGGGDGGNSGNITVNGGIVTATGGGNGAGIGGGNEGGGGTITVNSGTVTATGGDYSAGIGGGFSGSGGTITVNGGVVTANCGQYGAGIGGGSNGDGGIITISGGDVTATGGYEGAGIGGGYGRIGGTITVNSGTVTATGGQYGAGIGGGFSGSGGTITVNGGVVTANGGYDGAGIGGGQYGNGVTVTINGGTVTATGGDNGAGIGGGFSGSGGTITVNGGVVTANGGYDGAGIGGGNGGNRGTFSTGENGNAFIIASSISDQSYKTNSATSGIIIEGDNGTVYGNPTLNVDFILESGKTLTIPEGSTLTIADGATLTNNGTVNVEGTLVLPADTEVNEALFNGFTGSGKIVIGEKIYTTNGDDMGAVFANISASLGEDISLTYYIDKGDFATAPRMRFTINGYTTIVSGVAKGENLYAYKFTGIAPQWMGDIITAELLGEDDTVIGAKLYSVLRYLNRLKVEYSEEEYPTLHQLINDLLVYGGAAQVFTGYKTSELVSDGITGSSRKLDNKADFSLIKDKTHVDFTGATVNFNNINRLKVFFTAESIEGLTIKYKLGDSEEWQEIAYSSDGKGGYVIVTEGISASKYTEKYTFAAFVGEEQGATLTYSINCYAYSMKTSSNDAMAALAIATYNYGVSAKAYAEAN